MANPTFDEFAALLDEVIDSIPQHFLGELNGGFNLRPEPKRDGRYYIMGQYIENGIGNRFIVFYYGTFVALLDGKPLELWKERITEVVFHEMQHHMEARAGRDDLARQEMEELARALHRNK